MNKYFVENISKIRLVYKLYKDVFSCKKFPEFIFANKNWEILFFESWSIFDSNTYHTFTSFLQRLNEKYFFLVPDSFQDLINDYLVKNIQKKELFPIVCIETGDSFEEFDVIKHDFGYNAATDSFIFGSSRKWGIDCMPMDNLLIFGIDKKIKDIFINLYENHPDKIDIDRFIELLEADSVLDKELKHRIIQNYK
jgi:hypothetical protein